MGIAGIMLAGIAGWSLAGAAKDQRAEFSIARNYVVGGATLNAGKYLVIHKDAPEEGEACTFFYRLPYSTGKEPAAKVRCTGGQAAAAKNFTMKSVGQPDGSILVRSIQFAGSTDVHNLDSGS
jgi:hypothetical protein